MLKQYFSIHVVPCKCICIPVINMSNTYYAKFTWFPKDSPLYLHLIPAILQLIVIVTNIFILIVFLRNKLTGGINVILIGMAIADATSVLLLMVSYWYALLQHVVQPDSLSTNQIHFLCITAKYGTNVSITFNMVSIWLITCLGIIKFVLVRFPLQAKFMVTTSRLILTTVIVYASAFLFSFPHYVTDNYDISAKILVRKFQEEPDVFYCAITRKGDDDVPLYLENDELLVRCICVHLLPLLILLCTNTFFCYKLVKRNAFVRHSPKFKRSVKIVCALTFIHLLSEVPYSVFFCLRYYMAVTKEPISILVTNLQFVMFVLYLLRFVNYLSNFWVYLVLNKKFRETCHSLFCQFRKQN